MELYFVRNQEEYDKAISSGQKHIEIYFINDQYPYFNNQYSDQKYVCKWEETTFAKMDIFSRYWLNEYKNIDKLVSNIIQHSNMKDDKIAQSDHFKLDIIWELGQYYLEAIDLLDGFLAEKRPYILHYNRSNNFISQVIKSISQNHGIEIKKI